jgi:hypothetical protein
MIGDYQKYEVTAKFTFEAEVFPEDPNDVYQLAELEKGSLEEFLRSSVPDIELQELTVTPVIGE